MTQKLIEVLKKCSECFNIKSLSKTISGMPNRKQAFFMSVKLVNPTISHYSQGNTIISHIYVRYDGLTPQNKPHGEYVGRLLIVPRVKPITIFLNGYFLKTLNLLGAYQMLKSYQYHFFYCVHCWRGFV